MVLREPEATLGALLLDDNVCVQVQELLCKKLPVLSNIHRHLVVGIMMEYPAKIVIVLVLVCLCLQQNGDALEPVFDNLSMSNTRQ